MELEALIPEERTLRLSRTDYDRIVRTGVFHGRRLELIEGRILTMSPESALHAWTIDMLTNWFARRLPAGWWVSVQHPFGVGSRSEPEPDLAIVPASRSADEHPEAAALVIEVADSSLRYDRLTKGPLYAQAGVPEYWIVNLRERVIEIHTMPRAERYAQVRQATPGDRLAPAAFPELVIGVEEILPPTQPEEG